MDILVVALNEFLDGVSRLTRWLWGQVQGNFIWDLLKWTAFGVLGWRLPAMFRRISEAWANPLRTGLKDYRGALAKRIERLDHRFIKAELNLSKILVPVTVVELAASNSAQRSRTRDDTIPLPTNARASRGSGEDSAARGSVKLGVEDLSNVLLQVFSHTAVSPGDGKPRGTPIVAPGAPFIAITGDPGSGKSIALRVAALDAWALPRPAFRLGDRQPNLIPVMLTFRDLSESRLNLVEAIARGLRDPALRFPSVHPSEDSADSVSGWVESALNKGRLLVLIDGLDELDKDARTEAAGRVKKAIDTWEQTPFVITCRTEAWRDHRIEHTRRIWLQLQPFNDSAIRQFVRRWHFAPLSLADDLLGVIHSRPHFAELARNPLTLTILCWWFENKHGARLPDNRALFYRMCCEALLSEWDLAKHLPRKRAFGMNEKEDFLSFLAYRHITDSGVGTDIGKEWLSSRAYEWGEKRGRLRHDIDTMLDELCKDDGVIVPNLPDGILVSLPPDELTFSHRTFLEFFAALHLIGNSTFQAMIDHYASDRSRWQQVLLFYCGLCKRADEVSHIVNALLERNEIAIALTALSEARHADVAASDRILRTALGALQSAFHPAIIRGLGDLLASPHEDCSRTVSEFLDNVLERSLSRRDALLDVSMSAQAKMRLLESTAVRVMANKKGLSEKLLMGMIGAAQVPEPATSAWEWLGSGALFNEFLQDLVLAMLRRPSPQLNLRLPILLRKLHPERILPAMQEQEARRLCAGVLRASSAQSLETQRLQLAWIDGLRRARALPILFDLDTQSWPSPAVADAIGVALGRCSELDEFWTLADSQTHAGRSSTEDDGDYMRWGWPYEPPVEPEGKLLCWRVADRLSRDGSWLDTGDVDARMRYLACSLALERGEYRKQQFGWRLTDAVGNGTPETLLAVWKRGARMRTKQSARDPVSRTITALGLTLNVLLALLLFGSILTRPLGLGDLGVGWPSVFSGLFCLLGLMLAGAVLTVTGEEWWGVGYGESSAFFKLAAEPAIVLSLFIHLLLFVPLSFVSWLASLNQWEDEPLVAPFPSGGSHIRIACTSLAAVGPLALLWVFATGGTGHALWLILAALTLINPFYLLTYSAETTHPLFPSKKTRDLLDRLTRGGATRR